MTGFVALAVALGAAAHAVRDRPGLLWAGSWVALAAVAAAKLSADPVSEARVVAFCGPLIPGFLLAGCWAVARDRSPRWLPPLVFGFAVLRLLAHEAGVTSLVWPIALGVEPAGSLVAAELGRQAARRTRLRSAAWLPLLCLAIAALDGISGTLRWAHAESPGWLVAAWGVVLVLGLGLELWVVSRVQMRRQQELRSDTETRLRETQQRFRALTESAFDLIAELDDEERFTYVNPRYREVLGHAPEDLLGRHPTAFIHPDDHRSVARFAEEAASCGMASGLRIRALHRTGRERWLEIVARAGEGPRGERRWVLNARDVTAQQAMEESLERSRQRLEATVAARTVALHESEARFRALADHAPELISEFDAHGRYLFANAAFRDLLGWEPSDLIGTSPEALIHPDDLNASRRGMGRAMRHAGASHAMHRLRHADGSWRWFENTGRAWRTRSGQLRFVSIGRDVTEVRRAEAERRRLESHVQEVQRLESLGVLAGGIAHDFNNLLAVILGNVSLLEARPTGAEDANRLRRIRAAARHAQALTEQMLTYAGRSVAKLLPLDLSEVVRDTRDLLQAAVSPEVTLRLELADTLPLVDGDATQLRQVLVNLVTNASEALEAKGGRIEVRTGVCRLGDEALRGVFGAAERRAGEYVVLEVRDDGPGLDEAVRSRIFEPFFSTRRAGRGLGLAATLGIVVAHRGLLKLETAAGEGATFTVLLPVSSTTAAAEARRPSGAEGSRPRAVLVVDDEEAVREVAQAFLERAGLRTVPASSGREALERLREEPSIGAVLLDLAMPDLSGPETLHALRAERPDLPIVIASGYPRGLAAEQVGGGAHFDFVQKPYDPQTLVAALIDALGRAEPDPPSLEAPR